MSADAATTGALAALLRYIAGVRDQAVAEVDGRAGRECRELLAAARRKARAQLRQALAEERREAEHRISLARAAAQGRLRRIRHALTAATLAQAWTRIEHELSERWHDPAGRRGWALMALAEAQRHLPDGAWRIRHAPDWTPAQGAAGIARLRAERPRVTLQFLADDAIGAGLRIACGPAELDATAGGLLADRARVSGLWLAELERSVPIAARKTGT